MIATNALQLQRPPDGWVAYDHYLLSNGDLAVLWTDRDINAEYRSWLSRSQKSIFPRKMPDLWTGKAKLNVSSKTGESSLLDIPLVRYPKIDRFPDGRWLLAASRAHTNDRNGLILDESGQPYENFHLGDGIGHVRCAQDGTIWVGYFDEGVFGGSLGSGGIVQFDANGQPLWSCNDQTQEGASFIDDCYALSLNGNEVWTCSYSDFSVRRLKAGNETQWTNKIAGARALAVEGSFVLLAGGYGADRNRLALLRLLDGNSQLIGCNVCDDLNDAALVSGRSSSIHVVNNGVWSRIRVAEIQEKLS